MEPEGARTTGLSVEAGTGEPDDPYPTPWSEARRRKKAPVGVYLLNDNDVAHTLRSRLKANPRLRVPHAWSATNRNCTLAVCGKT